MSITSTSVPTARPPRARAPRRARSSDRGSPTPPEPAPEHAAQRPRRPRPGAERIALRSSPAIIARASSPPPMMPVAAESVGCRCIAVRRLPGARSVLGPVHRAKSIPSSPGRRDATRDAEGREMGASRRRCAACREDDLVELAVVQRLLDGVHGVSAGGKPSSSVAPPAASWMTGRASSERAFSAGLAVLPPGCVKRGVLRDVGNQEMEGERGRDTLRARARRWTRRRRRGTSASDDEQRRRGRRVGALAAAAISRPCA